MPIMNQEEYQSWISRGHQLTDLGLEEISKTGNLEQAWAKLNQAESCFSTANDLHWQAYLSHQKFHLYIQLNQTNQVYSIAHQAHQQYKKSFDFKGLSLFTMQWGQFLVAQGKHHQGFSLFRAAIAIATDKAPDRLPLIYCNLGAEYLQSGDFITAIHSFDQALSLKDLSLSQETWCFKALGDAFIGLYRPQQADRLYRKALKGALKQDDLELAQQTQGQLLGLEKTLHTGFATSDLGLQAKSSLKSFNRSNQSLL